MKHQKAAQKTLKFLITQIKLYRIQTDKKIIKNELLMEILGTLKKVQKAAKTNLLFRTTSFKLNAMKKVTFLKVETFPIMWQKLNQRS